MVSCHWHFNFGTLEGTRSTTTLITFSSVQLPSISSLWISLDLWSRLKNTQNSGFDPFDPMLQMLQSSLLQLMQTSWHQIQQTAEKKCWFYGISLNKLIKMLLLETSFRSVAAPQLCLMKPSNCSRRQLKMSLKNSTWNTHSDGCCFIMNWNKLLAKRWLTASATTTTTTHRRNWHAWA